MFVPDFRSLRHSSHNAPSFPRGLRKLMFALHGNQNTKRLCCVAVSSLNHSETKAILIDHNENKCTSQMVSLQEAGHTEE